MGKIELHIKNFPAQQQIFDAKERYIIVPKGRRFGITRGAANNYIKMGLKGEFKQGLWGDVVNSNIEKYIQRYFVPHLKKLPANLWKWSKDPHTVYIKDSYIDFRSAERPESWEGFGYDYMFLNEAGIILKSQYLWENAIKPMLWDTDCKSVIGGTPKGGGGEFQKLYQRGIDASQPDYKSFRFTPFDNPYIDHQRIRDDMKDMSELSIKQEIYAEFLEDAGVVFRGVSEAAILDPREPENDHLYVMGVDLAKVQDFTVITVYDRKDNHQVFQWRFNQLEYDTVRTRIKMVSDRYHKALVHLDSTGVGEPIFEDLSRMGVPVEAIHFTNELKKQLIEKMSNWIQLKTCYLLDLKETKDELNQFTYDFSEKTGRIIYGAPVGFHDDIVISHALAIWGLQPIIKGENKEEMSIIQRDIYEKKKQSEDEANGIFDPNEYEIV